MLAQLELLDSTAILVTADHGGSGKDHGKQGIQRAGLFRGSCRARLWIADFDLTLAAITAFGSRTRGLATVCWLLAIGGGEQCEGRPVIEILATAE